MGKAGIGFELTRPRNVPAFNVTITPALLPEDYVPDVHLRLMLYKRIASAGSHDELREMQVEMIDRFGLLPAAAKNFMRIAAVKLDASALCIEKIDASRSGGYLVFGKKTLVDPVALVRLVQNDSHTYRMQGAERLQFRLELPEDDDRFTFVEQLLQELSTDPASARRLPVLPRPSTGSSLAPARSRVSIHPRPRLSSGACPV